jgi:hypothetical protein
MDMDRLVRRVSEQLAAQPSRRGIVSAVAKLAAVAGVALAGLRHPGEAAAQAIEGTCCTGRVCQPNGATCPGGTKKHYQWFCNYQPTGERHLCRDCFSRSNGYECTAVTTR